MSLCMKYRSAYQFRTGLVVILLLGMFACRHYLPKKKLPTLLCVLFDGGEGSSFFMDALDLCTFGFEPLECYRECIYNTTAKSALLSATYRAAQEPSFQNFEKAAQIADSWNHRGNEFRKAQPGCSNYAFKMRLADFRDEELIIQHVQAWRDRVRTKFVSISRAPFHAAISHLRTQQGKHQFTPSDDLETGSAILVDPQQLHMQVQLYREAITRRFRFLHTVGSSFVAVDHSDISEMVLVVRAFAGQRVSRFFSAKSDFRIRSPSRLRQKISNWQEICTTFTNASVYEFEFANCTCATSLTPRLRK